jgi:hypothetical protein
MTTRAKTASRVAGIKALRQPLRPLDQELANDRELGAKVSENAARVKAKLGAFAAKKTYAEPRRDLLQDRDIFEEIQRSLRTGHKVRLTSRSPGPVIGGGKTFITTKTSHRLEKEEHHRLKEGRSIGIIRRKVPVHLTDWKAIERIDRRRRKRGELEKVIWVPHWDRTGHLLKGFAWSMAVWERAGAVMTVNIGESVIEAAGRDARGFATHMRERMKRELRAVSNEIGFERPEFFFVVEASELGRPHLHGGITLPQDPQQHRAIRDALYRASHGRAGGAKRTGREIDLRTYETPAIWANYAAKWARGSAERVQGRVFAASTGVRVLGKAWYDLMRRTEGEIGGHQPDDDLIAPLASNRT